ncbi:MAG TPA: CHAD domain-containing protein [Polyangiaceae bacterium]|jgi:CHAD domain-containing protein|nr:CHAD domain-containing protein [Polyangiaceae bacterium]
MTNSATPMAAIAVVPAAPVAEPQAPEPMTGAFLVARLRELETELASVGPRLLTPSDDEAVHDLRVALRRTRTLLEVGRSVLGGFQADEVRRALRDMQRISGVLRDEEVVLEIAESLTILGADARPEVIAGVNAWLEARKRRERRLRAALRRKVRDGELERGRRLLDALLAFRTKPSRDRRLLKFARKAVDRARREVDRMRAGPLHEPEALHDLRIGYKRLRYTVEAFASVLPEDVAALQQTAARFQGKLGKLHDVDMVIACVRASPALGDGPREALLVELQRARQARAESYERDAGA